LLEISQPEDTFSISTHVFQRVMAARNKNSRCPNCHNLVAFQTEITLKAARDGASRGCIPCKLLSVSAHLFRDRWSHLKEEEGASVSILVSRTLHGSGLALMELCWPSVAVQRESLSIQIMTEVCNTSV
jgi:hypothetical protein